MLHEILQLASLFRRQKINSDSFTAKLCYIFLSTLLVVGSIITFTNNYFGVHMQCLTSDQSRERLFTSVCWAQGTWTYANSEDFDLFRKQLGSSTMNAKADESSEESSTESSKSENPGQTFHMVYPYIPFIYMGFAFTCHFGNYIWLRNQGTTMPQLVRDLKNTKLDIETINKMISDSTTRFVSDIRQHSQFANNYTMACITNCIVVISQMLVLIICFGNGDYTYGYTALAYSNTPYDLWPHRLASAFPQITKCTIKSFGVGGNVVDHDALCFLVVNKVNMINFAIHYWLLAILIPLTLYELMDHLYKICSVSARSNEIRNLTGLEKESATGKFCNELDYGSAFVVTLLIKNIPTDMVCKILEGVKTEFQNNGAQINRRLNGLE